MGSRDFTCNSPKRRLRHVVESADDDRLVDDDDDIGGWQGPFWDHSKDYDANWADFESFHESIKEADCNGI